MLHFGSKITVSLIRSGKGDCIHIRFSGYSGQARNIIIDSGPPVSAAEFRKLYNEIIKRDKMLDCVIVTHYDEDHLGGLVKLVETEGSINIGSVYMNGVLPPEDDENPAHSSHTNLSARQNQELIHKLLEAGIPIENQVTAGRKIEVDGAILTVIAPDEERFGRVLGQLEAEETRIQKMLQEQLQEEPEKRPQEKSQKVLLAGESDWSVSFEKLMDRTYPSKSVTASNGASIVFVFQYDGYSFLFTGDAPAGAVIKGLKHWGSSALSVGKREKEDMGRVDEIGRTGEKGETDKTDQTVKKSGTDSTCGIRFQLVKLLHHGSAGNISDQLLSNFQADRFVICADGSGHPDKMTVSKLLRQYGSIGIYSNYSWWRKGFLCDGDQKYLTQGRLDFVNIVEEEIELP